MKNYICMKINKKINKISNGVRAPGSPALDPLLKKRPTPKNSSAPGPRPLVLKFSDPPLS